MVDKASFGSFFNVGKIIYKELKPYVGGTRIK
jgi:hypothetical protein